MNIYLSSSFSKDLRNEDIYLDCFKFQYGRGLRSENLNLGDPTSFDDYYRSDFLSNLYVASTYLVDHLCSICINPEEDLGPKDYKYIYLTYSNPINDKKDELAAIIDLELDALSQEKNFIEFQLIHNCRINCMGTEEDKHLTSGDVPGVERIMSGRMKQGDSYSKELIELYGSSLTQSGLNEE